MCAKSIINANIDEVVYGEEYTDTLGIALLRDHGLKVRKFYR